MIKKIAWNMFKNTGDINAYLEFCQFKDIQENLVKDNSINGSDKNKGNCYFRK